MFSTSFNVTLTRVVTRKLGDVNHISRAAAARYLTTSKPRPIPTTPQPQIRMQARERTQQIQNQLQRPYSSMSNNQDLQMDQVFNVKDKVALVTGGGSGIGLMITQTLAVNGAKVYIVGRTEEKLEKVVEVHGKGIAGQIIPIVGNVATKDGVQ
jgi:FlaA1/EpsC-like NDP-sugar epimerase